MTTKICSVCGEEKDISLFCRDSGYKDGRRSDCNQCRQERRKAHGPRIHSVTRMSLPQPGRVESVSVPYVQTVTEQDLPDPERLPAAYMKRVSDYWLGLIGGEEPARRIA